MRRSLYLHLRVGVVVGSIWESALRSGNRTTWDCWKYRCSKQQTREDLFLLDLSSYISFQKKQWNWPTDLYYVQQKNHFTFHLDSYITHLTNSYFKTKILLKFIGGSLSRNTIKNASSWAVELVGDSKKTVQQQSMGSQTSPKKHPVFREATSWICIYLEIFYTYDWMHTFTWTYKQKTYLSREVWLQFNDCTSKKGVITRNIARKQ